MLDNIKYLLSLKSVDKDISEKNYDLALEKLNSLIKQAVRNFFKTRQVMPQALNA